MGNESQLTIDVRPGERLVLDDGRIVFDVLEKSGKVTKLRVTAPRDVKIRREDCDRLAPCVAG